MVLLICLVLLGLFTPGYSSSHECTVDPEDDRVYSFSFTHSLPPYSYIDDDGKPVGTNVDLVRYICEVMNKQCRFSTNHFNLCWDKTKASRVLNNRWWDVCVGALQTAERRSAYGFVGEFTKEPPSYVYVRRGSGITTMDDLKDSRVSIGFLKGWWTDTKCLEKFLGVSLTDRSRSEYLSYPDVMEAVDRGQIDAMFITPTLTEDVSDFERVDTGPMYCSVEGTSMMVRKDETHNLAWVDEGLRKLRENGDYQWLCNLAKQRGAREICFVPE